MREEGGSYLLFFAAKFGVNGIYFSPIPECLPFGLKNWEANDILLLTYWITDNL